MASSSQHSVTAGVSTVALFEFAVIIASILLLMLCTRRKKRYVKKDEMDEGSPQRTGSPMNNGTISYREEDEKRASQHSLPNEGRNLPYMPTSNSVNDGSSTPVLSTRNDASSVESSNRNSRSSPKKSTTRRLPALPPDQLEIKQEAEDLQQKAVESTYEDLRDDGNAEEGALAETVGSGDSALYANVRDDLNKGSNDDTDLYAQVGGCVEAGDSQPGISGTNIASRNQSSSSEDDPSMDSPTAVTYASVDKMKKTMSVKRRRENSASSNSLSGAPPVPERNFDEAEIMDSLQDPVEDLPPPPAEMVEDPVAAPAAPDEHGDISNQPPNQQQAGPAYETLSVRESLAHQRLRQMVEDEQRNRYVNTSQEPDGTDLYSQISEDNPEALYESVSVPGSADGTVGVTGQSVRANPANGARQTGREDGYSTIGAVRRDVTDTSVSNNVGPVEESGNSSNFPPPPPDLPFTNPDYENIEMG